MMISKHTSACLRGLAIIMVVVSHYAEWMMDMSTFPAMRESLCGLGVLGVDLFFLVSGYGLVKSAGENGVGRYFLWNRLKACYLPYLLVVGLITLLEGGFRDFGDVKDYLAGNEYWYICVQMVLYVCFFVCYGPETVLSGKWKNAWNRMKDLLLTMLVIGFTYWLYALGRADFWIVSNGAFLIGVYIARLENEQKQKATGQITRLIPFALIFCLSVFVFSDRCFGRTSLMCWEMVKSMAFTLCAALIGLLHDFKSVPLRVLGKNSLYFYLIHGFIYRSVGAGLKDKAQYVILFAGLVTTLVVGLIIGSAISWFLEWFLSFRMKHIRHCDKL